MRQEMSYPHAVRFFRLHNDREYLPIVTGERPLAELTDDKLGELWDEIEVIIHAYGGSHLENGVSVRDVQDPDYPDGLPPELEDELRELQDEIALAGGFYMDIVLGQRKVAQRNYAEKRLWATYGVDVSKTPGWKLIELRLN